MRGRAAKLAVHRSRPPRRAGQVGLYHTPTAQVYCLVEGPDEDAIRQHHAALGVSCGDVHQLDSVT